MKKVQSQTVFVQGRQVTVSVAIMFRGTSVKHVKMVSLIYPPLILWDVKVYDVNHNVFITEYDFFSMHLLNYNIFVIFIFLQLALVLLQLTVRATLVAVPALQMILTVVLLINTPMEPTVSLVPAVLLAHIKSVLKMGSVFASQG